MEQYEQARDAERSAMEVALLLESGLTYTDIHKTTLKEQHDIIAGRNALEEERERKAKKNQPSTPKV